MAAPLSKVEDFPSVLDLIKEGRAALCTSFASYKFLIMYGQLFSVLKLICFYYGVIMYHALTLSTCTHTLSRSLSGA